MNECGEIYHKPLMDGMMSEHGGVKSKVLNTNLMKCEWREREKLEKMRKPFLKRHKNNLHSLLQYFDPFHTSVATIL